VIVAIRRRSPMQPACHATTGSGGGGVPLLSTGNRANRSWWCPGMGQQRRKRMNKKSKKNSKRGDEKKVEVEEKEKEKEENH